MPRVTELPSKVRGVYFQTRNLDERLAKRLRLRAAERGVTMEQTLNELVALAFDVLDARERRRASA